MMMNEDTKHLYPNQGRENKDIIAQVKAMPNYATNQKVQDLVRQLEEVEQKLKTLDKKD